LPISGRRIEQNIFKTGSTQLTEWFARKRQTFTIQGAVAIRALEWRLGVELGASVCFEQDNRKAMRWELRDSRRYLRRTPKFFTGINKQQIDWLSEPGLKGRPRLLKKRSAFK
jgi:hypothetical protein